MTPHNLDAEQAVLGAVLRRNDLLKTIDVLQPEDFYRQAHALLFRQFKNLHADGTAIDLVTLVDALKGSGELDAVGGPAYVASLVDGVPSSVNVEHYAGIVKRDAERRRVLTLLTQSAREIETNPDAFADTVKTIATIASSVSTAGTGSPPARRVVLTKASSIPLESLKWLWPNRLQLGAFALLGGREGLGKSTVCYTLGALLTRGQLPGAYYGQCKALVVAATEDAWSTTVNPRLVAAGADLDRVYRVDVQTVEGLTLPVSLPRDLVQLEASCRAVDAGMILLDPLLSRLDAGLDSHKDSEVRRALEPLAALADRTNCTVLGLVHVNKSGSDDALTSLMGSRAFAAVARNVLFVAPDPEDERTRLLAMVKGNNAPGDVPMLAFRITKAIVGLSDTGDPIETGQLEWLGESDRSSIREVLAEAHADSLDRGATDDAAEWLRDTLTAAGGSLPRVDIIRAASKAGHSKDSIRRAKQRLRVASLQTGFPRKAVWSLPASASAAPAAPTAPTGAPVSAAGAVSAVNAIPQLQMTGGIDERF